MPSFFISKTMKGIQIHNFGGPEVLQHRTNLPVPVPRDGEVLVKNDFIGVNYVDVYWRTGMMGVAPNGIIGREGEGVILAIGSNPTPLNSDSDFDSDSNKSKFKVGDRVVWLGMGGYAEYTAVSALATHLVPLNVEPGIAAAT